MPDKKTLRFSSRLKARTDNVDQLGQTNDVPNDEQVIEIRKELQILEAEFERVTGYSYTYPYTQDVPASLDTKYGVQIRKYRSILSCIRHIPEEIWQRILVFATSSATVHKLSAVCRIWRVAALTHPDLWRIMPTTLSCCIQNTRKKAANLSNLVKLYIQRSGSLPISFELRCFSRCGGERRLFLPILSLLLAEAHRWGALKIRAPIEVYDYLSAHMEYKLEMLADLEVEVSLPIQGLGGVKTVYTVNCFSDAPKLRHAIVHGFPLYSTDELIIAVSLPYPQLETFKSVLAETAYSNIIQSNPRNLTSLDSTVSKFPSAPPNVFVTMHKLEMLRIRGDRYNTMVPPYLNYLTLPSLTDLEVHEGPERGTDLFLQVRNLIWRSGCSLRRLSLSEGDDTQVDDFRGILSISPNLEELDICRPSRGILLALELDVESPEPILPKLEVLTIEIGSKTDPFLDIDVPALKAALRTRPVPVAENPPGSHDKDSFKQLKEVRFCCRHTSHRDRRDHLQRIQALFEPSLSPSLTDVMILDWQSRLRKDFLVFGYEIPRAGTSRNVKAHLRMDSTMRELEAIGMSEDHIRILSRTYIPSILEWISLIPVEFIPEGRAFSFPKRAKTLYDKWKLVFFQYAKMWSYRWCLSSHPTPTMAVLKPVTSADEELDWWEDLSRNLPGEPLSLW